LGQDEQTFLGPVTGTLRSIQDGGAQPSGLILLSFQQGLSSPVEDPLTVLAPHFSASGLGIRHG
jgi:hypothetical protein